MFLPACANRRLRIYIYIYIYVYLHMNMSRSVCRENAVACHFTLSQRLPSSCSCEATYLDLAQVQNAWFLNVADQASLLLLVVECSWLRISRSRSARLGMLFIGMEGCMKCKYMQSYNMHICANVHIFLHACMHAIIRTYMQTYIHADRQTDMPTHAPTHTHTHACVHTYAHAYIHAYLYVHT